MANHGKGKYPDPREEDIMAGERRISRPDSALPDSIIPDASYRPIPIAWFTAALLCQLVLLFTIFLVLVAQNGWLTIFLGGIATGAIGKWTFDRGMKDAAQGWQIATVAMLTIQLAFICLSASSRI